MNTDKKNRKLWWGLGAILAALYFGPQMVESSRRMALYRQQLEARQTHAANASPTPASLATPMPTPNAALASYFGIWTGQQAQADHDVCQLALEMRETTLGQLTAYPRLACYPTPYLFGGKKFDARVALAKSMSPISAVLTGTPKDGAVSFHVDKTIGATPEGCAITSFSVTPFGNNQIAAEWQDGNCGKGEMMLSKVSK